MKLSFMIIFVIYFGIGAFVVIDADEDRWTYHQKVMLGLFSARLTIVGLSLGLLSMKFYMNYKFYKSKVKSNAEDNSP